MFPLYQTESNPMHQLTEQLSWGEAADALVCRPAAAPLVRCPAANGDLRMPARRRNGRDAKIITRRNWLPLS